MKQNPLVFCLTNTVAANFTANCLLVIGAKPDMVEMPWIENPVSTHGTGCSLAAALTAELALARPLPVAVEGAKAYVHAAIENSFLVGKDCGVLGFSG